MSSVEKDLDKIIALAERSQYESVFQNHLQYKKFKARYQNQVVQSPTYFGNMYRVLRSKKFYNEHVFWGMKILENQRLGNKEDRAYTLYLIVNSFYNLNDYENVLKYGGKALEHEIQPNELTDTKAKRRFLEVMQDTSLLFQKKRDAMEYAKEILKLDVIRCNKKEFEKFYLLQSYHNLIELQIGNGDFKSAQKTIDKHLSIFNLNSMDRDEVILSIAKEGYGKILPWNHLLVEPHKITGSEGSKIYEDPKLLKTKLFEDHEFFKNSPWNVTDQNTMRFWYKMVHLYYFIGKICWQKYEINLHFEIKGNIFRWAYMALKILDDILYHIQVQDKSNTKIDTVFKLVRCGFNRADPVRLSEELNIKNFILYKISATLLLADHDRENRESWFLQLIKKLFLLTDTYTEDTDTKSTDSEKTDNQDTNTFIGKNKVIWYIAESLRTNDRLDVLKVMPFIQFCLKYLNENVSDIEGAQSDNNVDIKVQMMTLKNSLTIMNHFKAM